MGQITSRLFGALLAALAALLLTANADAARKTWTQECNEKPKDERDQCCTTKTLDCYAACFEQFGRTGYRSDQCLKLCKSASETCHKSVKATSLSGRSTTTQTQAPKFNQRRVCCQTGRRVAWANPRDCRARRGRTVKDARCRKPGRRTGPQQAVVCCRKGGRTWLTSQRQCRAQRGRTVNGRLCVRR